MDLFENLKYAVSDQAKQIRIHKTDFKTNQLLLRMYHCTYTEMNKLIMLQHFH
jgi:hypothetical protein